MWVHMSLCLLVQIAGFPIQMSYTDVQSVVDAVYQTGTHSSEFPQTEFALAVYIHPYPNNILSVWVYLASLARQQWKGRRERKNCTMGPLTRATRTFPGTLGFCFLTSSLAKCEPTFWFTYRVGHHGNSLPEFLRMSLDDLLTRRLFKEDPLRSRGGLGFYSGKEEILASPSKASVTQIVGLTPPPSKPPGNPCWKCGFPHPTQGLLNQNLWEWSSRTYSILNKLPR